MRDGTRKPHQLRKIELIPNYLKHAEGSCLAKFGDTHVICTASIDATVPPFLRNSGKGWVTAEYGMLPRSTHERMDREAAKGKQSGRTQEIQRLIGRALRSVVDMTVLGEKQIKIDCDVIQADGGTRTAAITGAYVALRMALDSLYKAKLISAMPIREEVAAISCGIIKGTAMLDLDYAEDSSAEVDANFVMTASGKIVEIQGTAEGAPFTAAQFQDLMGLATGGISGLIDMQRAALQFPR